MAGLETMLGRLTNFTCPPGQVMFGVDATLTPVCVDDLTVNGLCPGGQVATGVSGGVVRCGVVPDPTVYQKRVAGECPPGSSIRQILVNGSVVCWEDRDTIATPDQFQVRGNASCPTGSAIATIFANGSVACFMQPDPDPALWQRRVNGSCPTGFFAREVYANGSVACVLDVRSPEAGTALYIHWGKKGCPSEFASEVYTGW